VQARRNLEVAQATFTAGQGDAMALVEALRTYLQVRIERVRTQAELFSSQADLQRAAGTLALTPAGAP
jgi:outer membrane protein TolC